VAGAEALLQRIAGRSRALAEPAVRAWLREHGDEAGPAAIAAVLRAHAGDTALVDAGFLALGLGGPTAGALVGGLAEDPSLEAPALLWLLQHADLELPPLSTDSRPAHVIAALAHLLSGGECLAVERLGDLGPLDEVARYVDSWWAIPGRATERVLDAVADHHPHQAVVRAARKALLKLRTARVG
jgi:hypothetical protein